MITSNTQHKSKVFRWYSEGLEGFNGPSFPQKKKRKREEDRVIWRSLPEKRKEQSFLYNHSLVSSGQICKSPLLYFSPVSSNGKFYFQVLYSGKKNTVILAYWVENHPIWWQSKQWIQYGLLVFAKIVSVWLTRFFASDEGRPLDVGPYEASHMPSSSISTVDLISNDAILHHLPSCILAEALCNEHSDPVIFLFVLTWQSDQKMDQKSHFLRQSGIWSLIFTKTVNTSFIYHLLTMTPFPHRIHIKCFDVRVIFWRTQPLDKKEM